MRLISLVVWIWIGRGTALLAPNRAQSRNSRPLSASARNFWSELLESATVGTSKKKDAAAAVLKLKTALINECEGKQQKKKVDRDVVESYIDEFAKMTPITQTAASEKLQKKWLLIWTTEKEINFFLDTGLSNGNISQTIKGDILENRIPFGNGSRYFGVTGRLNIPDPAGIRTEFVFEQAMLELDNWGRYQFPPVGKGWFDTLYLDDELRIDCNSRNDILICHAAVDAD